MPTVASSGTQAASVGTEHTVYTTSTSAVYVFVVNCVNMASADLLELRIKSKVLSGDTLAVVYKFQFQNAQDADDVIKISVPFPSDLGADFTLKQVKGTSRNFPWKVLTI